MNGSGPNLIGFFTKPRNVTFLHPVFHTALYLQPNHMPSKDISGAMAGRFALFSKTKVYIFLSPREPLSEILHKRFDCAKVNGI